MREREDTIAKLGEIFEAAMTVGRKTASAELKTRFGLKDTFMEHFIRQSFNVQSNTVGNKQARQEAVDGLRRTLPTNVLSPVWRIRGLNPHTDTPVETLHVVLLGFVKYLWRDSVMNQTSAMKSTLVARLCSLDVFALGLSPLDGNTLVSYAGSLTGRDFRVIVQVAPYVLYDVIPSDALDSWVSLGDLWLSSISR